MATQRQSIIRGPGTVTYKSVKFHDASGIEAELVSATSRIPSSICGDLDTIKTDQHAKITLTPVGTITEARLAALFPAWLQTPAIGGSVFGSTDSPLIISSMAGQKVTFLAAALTKPPDLQLSPIKTAFGQAEFTALLANGKLPTDANSLYTVAAAAYEDSAPARGGLTGCHYVGTFGSLSIPDTVDGWNVTIEPELQPVVTDSQGTIDYTIAAVRVRATCTPLGLSEAQILGALPALQGRGASIASANDLVVAATGGLTVTLKKASLVTGPLNWGTTALRAGQIGFEANVDPTDGALFSVVMTPAPTLSAPPSLGAAASDSGEPSGAPGVDAE